MNLFADWLAERGDVAGLQFVGEGGGHQALGRACRVLSLATERWGCGKGAGSALDDAVTVAARAWAAGDQPRGPPGPRSFACRTASRHADAKRTGRALINREGDCVAGNVPSATDLQPEIVAIRTRLVEFAGHPLTCIGKFC